MFFTEAFPSARDPLAAGAGLLRTALGWHRRTCGAGIPETGLLFEPSVAVDGDTPFRRPQRRGTGTPCDPRDERIRLAAFEIPSTPFPGEGKGGPRLGRRPDATTTSSLRRGGTDGNDPSAGSPTETLLRLLLPLNDQVWSSFRHTGATREPLREPVRRPH